MERTNGTAMSRMYLKDTAFQDLMQRRIFNVLLVATPYDTFMMEEDGRVEEQVYFEYVSLNLSSPPRFTKLLLSRRPVRLWPQKISILSSLCPGWT